MVVVELAVGLLPWFVLDFLSVLLLLPSRMGCDSVERVVIGGVYRRHSAMQACFNVVRCFFQCVFSLLDKESCFLPTLVL